MGKRARRLLEFFANESVTCPYCGEWNYPMPGATDCICVECKKEFLVLDVEAANAEK